MLIGYIQGVATGMLMLILYDIHESGGSFISRF